MQFAVEPAERALSRQITRRDARGAEVEMAEFDRAIELNEPASSDEDRGG